MKPLEIAAAVVGGLGIIVSIIIYQQKKGKKLLRWKLVSDFVWLVQYLLLGKFTGAGSCAVGVVRESVFLNQHRKWAASKLWLLVFVALSVVLSIYTWGNIYSILPMTASVIAVFSFWRANPTLTKILAYPICFCMLTYDIWGAGSISWMGIVNETLTLVSTTVSLISVLRKRRTEIAEPTTENAEVSTVAEV